MKPAAAPHSHHSPISLLLICTAVLVWSAIHPYDWLTWALEVFPAVIGMILLAATYRRFRFTNLVYVLIAAHVVILFIGGHYTYAEVPAFNWLRDRFDLGRNHFDRLGHFAQGFVPAMVAREVLLRTTPLKRGGWLFFIVTCVCLAISAAYELLEWSVAVVSSTAAEAFLSFQGDEWDTQKDMGLALVGAILAQLLLTRIHERQLKSQMHEKDCVQ